MSQQPGRVLVVDDERDILRACERILTGAGHEVVTLGSAEEAIDALATNRNFDVVLCDIVMPDLLGSDLFGIVRERWPHLAERFVFMTGAGGFPHLGRWLANAKNAVLEKPFTPDELLSVVASAVERIRGSAT
jgi:DNA-binding NtrC family response regulator